MIDSPRFSADELKDLRRELRDAGLDSFQAAQLLTAFLAQRGYGASADQARDAATRLEAAGCPVFRIEAELEAMALVM